MRCHLTPHQIGKNQCLSRPNVGNRNIHAPGGYVNCYNRDGRQNNEPLPKDIHVLIPMTCEHVVFHCTEDGIKVTI